MPTPNFTWEIGRLLCHIGRIADNDQAQVAEFLQGFDHLGLALQRSDLKNIEDVCSGLLARSQMAGEGRAILTEIRDKAKALREHETRVRNAYAQAGSLTGMAEALGVSYGTAAAWATALGINKKRQGYSAPPLAISGAQCRHAREYLGMTRDDFCAASGTGKTAIREFECGRTTPRQSTQDKIMRLFKRYNIVFYSDGTFQEAYQA